MVTATTNIPLIQTKLHRLQVMKNLQVTPDIQYIRNPALNPKADDSWVFGLRARLVL
jgi:carbohydrate-selective porin OprB